MPNATDKQKLRSRVIAARDAIPAAERAARSTDLRRDVLALPQVAAAQAVFAFVSHGSEVNTHPIIDALLDAGKLVAVPLILPRKDDPGRRMLAVPIQSRDDLAPGVMGILSPTLSESEILNLKSNNVFAPDLVLVPGVAFSRQPGGTFARLGYGGGYYDRYLARHPDAATVGLCFTEQVVTSLPTEPHDVLLQTLVTC